MSARQSLELPPALEARYQILAPLGEGSFGRVVAARDRDLDRKVAIKLGRERLVAERQSRFTREGTVLAKLRHPGVVEVYDVGLVDGTAYVVMEFLDGASLEAEPPADPVATVVEVAEALDAVHAAGVCHRDLKPANIFRTREGRTVVVDFGLALDTSRTRQTATGAMVGSLPYLPPEVLRGGDATPAADWFALGVTLYELLEGSLPWRYETLVAAGAKGELPPPVFRRIPKGSRRAALVRALLDPRPEARPSSSEQVRRILETRTGGKSPAPLSGAREAIAPIAGRRSEGKAGGRVLRIHPAVLGLGLTFSVGLGFGLGRWTAMESLGPGLPASLSGVAGSAPGTGTEETVDPAAAVRQEFSAAIRDWTQDHRDSKGDLRVAITDGSLLEHLVDSAGDLMDPMAAARSRRAVHAWLEAVRILPRPEAERLTAERFLPALVHLSQDFLLLEVRSRIPTFFARNHVGATGFDQAAARATLAAMEVQGREHQARIEAETPPWMRDTWVPAILGWTAGGREEGDRRRNLAMIRTALDRTSDPELRIWLAYAIAPTIPSGVSGRGQALCDLAESATQLYLRVLREPAPAPLARLRVQALASLFLEQFQLLFSCRRQLDAGDIRLLADLLDQLEAGIDLEPGAVAFASQTAERLYFGGAALLMNYGPEFREQILRLEALADRTRKPEERFQGQVPSGLPAVLFASGPSRIASDAGSEP